MKKATRFSVAAVLVVAAILWFKDRLGLLPAWNGFTGSVNQFVVVENASKRYWAKQWHVVSPTPTVMGTPIATVSSARTIAPYLRPCETLPPTKSGQDEQHGTQSTVLGKASAQVSPLNDKVIVMGKRKDEDTSWVEEKLPDWQNAIYTVDDLNATLHTSMNKGHEANPYLTYIIAHYNRLPSTMAFIHSHEAGYPKAWHTDANGHSNVNSLRLLNIDFVQRNGYANLRCVEAPGCPDEIRPFRQPHHDNQEWAFPDVWKHVFGEEVEIPDVIATPCCAQFAVSSTQVRRRPLEFYVRAHRHLQGSALDDETSGRVYEYLWHIMFGQSAV